MECSRLSVEITVETIWRYDYSLLEIKMGFELNRARRGDAHGTGRTPATDRMVHACTREPNAHRTVSGSLPRSIIMLNRSSSPLQGGAGDPAGRPDSESIVVGTLDFLQALLLGDATTYQGARELVAAILRVYVYVYSVPWRRRRQRARTCPREAAFGSELASYALAPTRHPTSLSSPLRARSGRAAVNSSCVHARQLA